MKSIFAVFYVPLNDGPYTLLQELIIEMRNPNVTWRIIWHVYLFTTELRHTCSSLLFLSK